MHLMFGVVVVEAEYAFYLRLAFRDRSQGDAQLSKRLLFLTFPKDGLSLIAAGRNRFA
jgi:hypothetical protein